MAAVAASGIAAAFVVGAVGLGIASVARTLANIRFRRRYHHRYGRSIREDAAALERTMALIRQEDVTGCGMRLVCELGARPARDRDAHGDAILELVGTLPPGSDLHALSAGEGVSALQEYRRARSLGERGHDCEKAFRFCPFNGTELMSAVVGYVS
ncbi:uncharacterized protein LOC125030899 [Penaeus chinensis]|uniref:uncharacterized protein LOC125030899 n=1 Tax=Penaeus chinensis TaxID=139456 RepID=UPI001FB5DCF3|nr:uncharacterized protein LOC125030899 [Penaeus chinensis]